MQEMRPQSFYIAAFTLFIGFFLAYLYFNTSAINPQQDDLASPKETAHVLTPPLPEKIFGLAGRIVSKSNRSLVLEINSLKDRVPVNGSIPKEQRIVQINGATSIKELTFSRSKLGSPPIERAIALADLSVGDQIIVTAQENIKEKNSFIASLIQKHLFE